MFSVATRQRCIVHLTFLTGLATLLACEVGDRERALQRSEKSTSGSIVLTLRPEQRFQIFEAWRATATGPDFLKPDGSHGRLAPALLNQILDDLAFDLGINGLRIHLHHGQKVEEVNDNDDPFSIRADGFVFAEPFQFALNEPRVDPVAMMEQVILPLKARVESRGEPFSTYISPHYDGYKKFPQHWRNPEEYAEVAEAYVAWTKARFNFIPSYWAIMNEPDADFFGPDRALERMIIATGARLKARGYPTRIQAPETVRPHAGQLGSILANPDARQYIGLISFHSYDYSGARIPPFGARNAIRDSGRQTGLRTAMTEVCCKWKGDYTEALGVARDIYWNLTEADVSVWEPLAVMFNCSKQACPRGGFPIAIEADLSTYYKFQAYYAMRQFSHHIRPGFRRVGIACSGCASNSSLGLNIKPVAFVSPTGDYVVVLINDQDAEQAVSLSGLPAGSYDITGVDPASTISRRLSCETIGQHQKLSYNVPGRAIVTFAQRQGGRNCTPKDIASPAYSETRRGSVR